MSRNNMIILANRKTCITGRELAKELGCRYHSSQRFLKRYYDIVWRYGNVHTPLRFRPRVLVNSLSAISNASNKPQFRLLLLHRGIPAPKMYNSWNIKELDPKKYPLIARPVNHHKGRHFHMIHNINDALTFLGSGFYLQEVVDKEVEYRVFVFRDKIFEVSVKRKDNVNAHPMIWNHDHGWNMGYINFQEAPKILKDISRQAAEISGLHFCAVDCCMDKNGHPWIFEVNSGPGLIPRKVTKLANKFGELYDT